MPHVTFIHGIGNKPPAADLLRLWRLALLDDDGLDLDEAGVTTSLIHWADLRYAEPLPPGPVAESVPGVVLSDPGEAWVSDLPPQERRMVESLAASMGVGLTEPPAQRSEPAEPVVVDDRAEALLLLRPFRRPLMNRFLKDVHDYLYDTSFSPRPGETYRTRHEIRRRAVDVLTAGAEQPGPHVVVGHSLGTVIAYDVLAAVPGAPPVDALVTIGSPLGISEVQEALAPAWSRRAGWPERTLGSGRWWNLFDRLDVVCGLDPTFAGQFRRDDVAVINDVPVTNGGAWRHDATKYLRRPRLRAILRAELGAELF